MVPVTTNQRWLNPHRPNLLCMKGTAALRAAVVASHRTVAPGKKPALLQLASGNLLHLMDFYSDLMGFYGDLMGCYSDSMGYYWYRPSGND